MLRITSRTGPQKVPAERGTSILAAKALFPHAMPLPPRGERSELHRLWPALQRLLFIADRHRYRFFYSNPARAYGSSTCRLIGQYSARGGFHRGDLRRVGKQGALR